eukprot:m.636340 g.636340  ORF g.636340 m.636340 type:complete len:211 (-) comp58308_c0_seq1:165-797(-)
MSQPHDEDKAADLSHHTTTPAGSFQYPSSDISLPAGGLANSPYFNLSEGGFNPAYIDQIRLNPAPEYLDGSETKHRTIGERVCYGAGVAYLTGHAIGGPWGLYEGLRHPEATSARLKINTVLNGITKRGPMVGNSFAILALVYNGTNGVLETARGGEIDSYNTVAAAALTGAIFKSTAGVRPMVTATVLGSGLALAWIAAKSAWKESRKA